jgi:signal transduction histidine kinase
VRLAPKIFVVTLVALAVLLGATLWSLGAMSRLVRINRSIVTRMAPALELERLAQDGLASLARLEVRAAVFRDSSYRAISETRASGVGEDLNRLGALISTPEERRRHWKTLVAFQAYRVHTAQPLPRALAPLAAYSQQARRLGARTERSLHLLITATRESLARAQAGARRLETRTWRAVGWALATSVFFALAGSAALAVRMTRSLRRLSTATAEIAQGSYRPLRIGRRDEIGQLARAFDQMSQRLLEVDRLKEEIFSHISHELRTPLTSVREATHLLRDRVAGPLQPKQERLLTIIAESTERVLALVNRILELSRLRAGLTAIERVPVDVARLAARAVDELRPQAEARGVSLHTNGASAAFVLGDQERLHEVLLNLVGNAIKFTTSGGAVRVRVAARGGNVEVAVEDTGVGIPAESLPRVFDRFWQARGSAGGSGLGLAIVKGIVDAHGGQVTATSEEGHGSRFTVALPRGEAAWGRPASCSRRSSAAARRSAPAATSCRRRAAWRPSSAPTTRRGRGTRGPRAPPMRRRSSRSPPVRWPRTPSGGWRSSTSTRRARSATIRRR